MPLPALSLWPGRQPYSRPRLVDGRRGDGPSSVAPRSRNPLTGRRRDSPISFWSHHHWRTAHHCAQSVKGSPTEPVLSRPSRQRLGHIQSHFDGGKHVFQAVFPEPQSAAARRRVERRDCAHEALPRLQSVSSWSVLEQLVSGACRLSCAFHAAGTVLLMWGGAIPASYCRCTLSKFVGLRQPDMIRQQSSRAGSSLRACADLVHTGQAYSAAE